ncbi:hypothetical protein [Planococcus glaciei]|uniref:hypothetical protein n=1 Tax=Planococcus glaciei TaxID=459472 RepID=UPI00128CDD89|nr:hypothetical protein [Planococcus glaciei]
MMDDYVLEIPDLGYVMSQDSIGQWEIFLRHTGQGFQKIQWQVTSSASGFRLRNMVQTGGPVESVHIDLAANRIVFQKGEMEDQEFQQFLRSLLDAFFIRVRQDQMHFVVSPNYLVREDFTIKE